MNYVDAGYAITLGGLFVYAISLVLRRRRWDRALRMSETRPGPSVAHGGTPAHGERS